MTGGDPQGERVKRVRDGRAWPIGTADEVAWITAGTRASHTITALIPPVFAAYATVVLPSPDDGLDPPEQETEYVRYIEEWDLTAPRRHERALLEVLREYSADQSWWLGYLDTGATDVVFPNAPMVSVYHCNWSYALVAAGPEQAATWRERGWNLAIPDLIFPADRSWLLSTGWDDTWTCIGAAEQLVNGLLSDPLLGARTRAVSVEEDATPSGRQAY
jgi:hypothetical protein